MISKSEFQDVLFDIVTLMQKQVAGFSGKQITDFLEVLNSSDDESLPVIVVSKDKVIYFRYPDGRLEWVDEEKINEVLDYEEFCRSGVVTLREKKAS